MPRRPDAVEALQILVSESVISAGRMREILDMSPEDQREGFLSAEFTRQQLAEMAREIALLVASEKARLCGYLCAYSRDYSK